MTLVKELHDKEKKKKYIYIYIYIYKLFYFYVLKELLPKIFS